MIHGQQSGQQAGSVWGIAMASAMGNGIVPRSTEETVAAHPAPRWPWSHARTAGEVTVTARRA